MANEEQLKVLKAGARDWNEWRLQNQDVEVNLTQADLKGSDLRGADLHWADLRNANLKEADLSDAILFQSTLIEAELSKAKLTDANLEGVDLSSADLREADLQGANLTVAKLSNAILQGANLSKANLKGAKLDEADLRRANLSEADLTEACLQAANLDDANLEKADLTYVHIERASLIGAYVDHAKISGGLVYGVNIWDLKGKFDEEKDLIVHWTGQASMITVDNIKIAQFIYLIMKNEEIRNVINVLTSKAVLILGRFAIPERKEILDALKVKLREYDLLPIVFDFDRPTDKDFTETIKTLAGISYFVIADVTNPKSSPLELQATVPDYQIPFVPIIQEGERPFAMMVDLQKKYPWVLPTKSYDSIETLMAALKPGIIDPAVEMRNQLRLIKAQGQRTESLKDYLDKTL
jgi:uncharacterized protein YjbI with pentapeptide repeats